MLPDEIRNKRILLSPLNWGMGHVARCIPLIDLLLKNKNEVFVAADKNQQHILKDYFPDLIYIDHEGYPFRFGSKGNFNADLLMQFLPLKKRLKNELKDVDRIVDEHSIDIVISDHRYGFRSKKVHSICLTHQLNLPIRWYEGWVQRTHTSYLSQFDEIWVPDFENSELSGELSRNKSGMKVSYIGSLSRFSLYNLPKEKDLDNVIIVSGPEVYARQFILEQLKVHKENVGLVYLIAPTSILPTETNSNIQFQASDDWKKCDALILRAKKITSRSGYSTLMDLSVLKTPFSISPTPGQREQEFLFNLWNEKALRNTGSFIQENKET
jgi:predicted glycosyltransferase